MPSVSVIVITISVGVCWFQILRAETNRCLSAYYDRQYAVSFFGDHSDWMYGLREELTEETELSHLSHRHCVRVRDREIQDTESNNHAQDASKYHANKNNHQPQKSISSGKFKGSKRKRKKEKQKKLRRKKNKR